MTKIDMHIHGAPWENGWAAYRRAVWQGWKAGCKFIGVAEHGPRFNHRAPFRSLYFNEFDRYIDTLQEIRLEFAGETEVLTGLELDYNEQMAPRYRELLPRLPLDFAVGSVHTVEDWVIDVPGDFETSSLAGLDALGIYQAYFAQLQEAVQCGLFNFIAHPDFVKKALPRLNMKKPANLQSVYSNTAEMLSACGVGIEINTRGLFLPEVGEFYPDFAFLQECARARVPLTIASDAHEPKSVALGIDEALSCAVKAGYRKICVWRKREIVEIDL